MEDSDLPKIIFCERTIVVLISKIHFLVSEIHFRKSEIHFLISEIHFWISEIHFPISKNSDYLHGMLGISQKECPIT